MISQEKGQNTDTIHMADEEVFIKSLKNPELFSIIFDRYQEPFLRKAKEILHNEQDAYDAVQEAYVRIYSAARQYRKLEGATFKSWAYKILMNQCFTMYQKKKKEFSSSAHLNEEILELVPDSDEVEEYDKKLTKDYAMSLVSRLPALLARVVQLYFIQEIPQKDIAVMEGVSNGVIRTRIHRAKTELRIIKSDLNI